MTNLLQQQEKLSYILLSQEVFRGICLRRAADSVSACQRKTTNDKDCEKQIQNFAKEVSAQEPSDCTNKLLVEKKYIA